MDRVTKYAKEIINGEIKAGDLTIKACERHLNDLERSGTEKFPYEFDVDKSNKIIDFAETLVIGEGMEKKPMVLKGFQYFIFGSLHGWVHKDTGFRRFRNSYIQIGRQQGKSILNGVLGLFYGNFDGYNYGQIYTTAVKQQQARIVLNEMTKFIESDEDLEELFEVKDYKSEIICKLTNSTIKALGRDTKSIDGFRPLLGVIDEYMSHPTDRKSVV